MGKCSVQQFRMRRVDGTVIRGMMGGSPTATRVGGVEPLSCQISPLIARDKKSFFPLKSSPVIRIWKEMFKICWNGKD